MNGARMRSYSLSGTRPAAISASVPRLIAPCSARTRTSPEASGPSGSSRISARPGATYQSASRRRSVARHAPSLRWTLRLAARYILRGGEEQEICSVLQAGDRGTLVSSASSETRIVGRRTAVRGARCC